MGFVNTNGYPLINEEHKLRISLSTNARIKMTEDMTIFRVSKATTFINTVFDNYKNEAKASISLYLYQRKLAYEELFSKSDLDDNSRKAAIECLLSQEKKIATRKVEALISSKGEGKLYHINNKNIQFLTEDCEEEEFYSRPGLYMRAVIEEYCSLPFIERERIYRKDVYRAIEYACNKHKTLKIKVNQYGKVRTFYVYPYKILPDPLQTQSYLTCYSMDADSEEKNKTIASFSMARLNSPTVLAKTFHLNKAERTAIQTQVEKNSPAYLLDKTEQIQVRLTENGKQIYQSRLSNRPERIEALSTDHIYVFDCTPRQIFNFFFSFGPEAEIMSPESIREHFHNTLADTLSLYSNTRSKPL